MNKKYDERQRWINYRLSHHALIIVFVLLLVNGLVRSSFEVTWAAPMAETFVLIALPTLYYITRSLFQGAYVGRRETYGKNGLAFAFIALIFLGVFIASGDAFIADGQLAQDSVLLLAGIFFAYITVLHGVKYFSENKRV